MTDTHTTLHIPDEAVQAALDLLKEKQWTFLPATNDIKEVLTAALPHLSAPCAVEVKKLTASERRNKMWDCGHGYAIGWNNEDYYRVKFHGNVILKKIKGLHKAVEWVNKHHSDLILSAIDISSCVVTKPVDVAAVREKVAREICLSYDQDPDDYASLLDVCGPNNEPLPQWHMYVLHSEAAKAIAAKDAEIARFTVDECEVGHKYAKLTDHPHKDGRPQCPHCLSIGLVRARERAEAAEAELAQIKAQEPVGYVVELWAKGNRNGTEYGFYVSRSRYQTRLSVAQSCVEHWKTQIYKDDRWLFKIIPLYAAPVSDSLKAEVERLREALTVASMSAGFKYMTFETRSLIDAALEGDSNDKG